ncbi:glycosyltransferase [Thalassococcus sp. CAU 1522]|uniref:Glycosyltransferase n=1 Tax=Thalassococcus arenae TaxID=2851652 RepID=A0ABS6N5R5_9RHOB|nr:glycosyltransferase [Thalassococcus arenae]MBV2358875.1 glycosyltransferase [Thalassococcus arenae]
MNILVIHQNFPGQFKHLAPALAEAGHRVVALTCKVKEATGWRGVEVVPYALEGKNSPELHPWLTDFETKLMRGTSCLQEAAKLKANGFEPDVILAHPGWGESLFLKDVWPEARLGLYCELYHQATREFVAFDPEFPGTSPSTDAMRLRLKNLNNRLHEEIMDAGISPTRFQADTFPAHWRERITVAHDGIDTAAVRPNPDARLDLPDGSTVTRADEVITFINRNLEPYRGYHIFMRALPDILRRRPDARVVMIGGDEVSYGRRPPGSKSWKQIFIDEVRGQIPDADWARVHFLGRVPYSRFLAMMQVSRVHVYLTYPFVLSWSLIEAMAAECAIVASATTPVLEVLEDGKTGVLVDFFDRAGLTEQVCALLDDPARRAALGRAAREFAIAQYDLKTVCLPRQIDWVTRLAQTTPRPPVT